MTHIPKTDKNRYFEILKNCQIWRSEKKHLKNAFNDILCTKHVLYACIVSYIALKVYKYY